MKNLIYIFIILLSGSCITQKKCAERFPLVASVDSVYIEKIKEIPVYLPGDTISINAPVNCPDQDIMNIETTKLKQQISILNGKLISKTTIKPDTIRVPVIQTIEKIKEVKVPQTVKVIPKVYLFSFWLWVGVILAIVGYFTIKKLIPFKILK